MAPPRKFNSLASWRNAENSLHSINLTMPYGTFESHAEVAGCLAFSRLCVHDVEIVVDAPVMATLTGWT